MHEAAIIEEVIRQALQEAEKNRLARISIVHLAVGRLHHLVPRTLSDLFDLMKEGSPVLAGAMLETQIRPLKFVCRSCGRETETNAPSFSCPACRSTDIRILSGNELILAHIEGEQDEGS
jgi:hydrogenase nickel incorporation protein HypA/HybF